MEESDEVIGVVLGVLGVLLLEKDGNSQSEERKG